MAHLTMLSEMMGGELPAAIERLAGLGIRHLDLKGGVFGRNIAELDDAQNERLAALVASANMEVYCFSSVLGRWSIDAVGEREFRERLVGGVRCVLATARCVRPALVRLLGCTFAARADVADANDYLAAKAPWVYAAYGEAIAALREGGLAVTIENEPGSIFTHPVETLGFFARLACPDAVGFTWDVQNMWQSGTLPSLAVYEALRPIVNYVHLKGGCGRRAAPDTLAYRTTLAQASWPVAEIVAAVLADGVSPVLCLNPPHGRDPSAVLGAPPGLEPYAPQRDVAFLRATFPEIE